MRLELESGPIRIDLLRRHLYVDGRHVNVTPMECFILSHLMAKAPETVSARDLYESATGLSWDRPDIENAGNSLKVILHRVRKAIYPLGFLLISTYGQGYGFHGEVTVTAFDLPEGCVIKRVGKPDLVV